MAKPMQRMMMAAEAMRKMRMFLPAKIEAKGDFCLTEVGLLEEEI